jgi:hypothetical protein
LVLSLAPIKVRASNSDQVPVSSHIFFFAKFNAASCFPKMESHLTYMLFTLGKPGCNRPAYTDKPILKTSSYSTAYTHLLPPKLRQNMSLL